MSKKYNLDDYDLKQMKEDLINMTEVPAKSEIYWNSIMASYCNLAGIVDYGLYNNYASNLYYQALQAEGVKIIKLAKKLGVDIKKYLIKK